MSRTRKQQGTAFDCCKGFFSAGFSALVLWLFLRISHPKCSVNHFYMPALNRSLNQSDGNTTLYLELKLRNPNAVIGLYYEDVSVDVTVFNAAKNDSYFVGNAMIPKFYQGYKKKAKKQVQIPYNKTVVAQGVSPNGTAVFRVDLATEVKYRTLKLWETDKYVFEMAKNVEMNENGFGAKVMNPAKKKIVPLFLVFLNLLVVLSI